MYKSLRKYLILFFCSFLTLASLSILAQTYEEEEDDDFLEELIFGEQEEVNCSNVLEYVRKYLSMSEETHSSLVSSAHRLLSEGFGTDITPEKKELLKEDLSDTVNLIQENQGILSGRASAIRDVLPECLTGQ